MAEMTMAEMTEMTDDPISWHRDAYVVTTDAARFDFAAIHAYLERSYWSPGISYDVVERMVAHSLGFGLFHRDRQVGFARVISDFTKFAYLADVYVLEEHQGRGLGTWLMECVLAHPRLQGLRRWMLSTTDAHSLYERFGFTSLKAPETLMERCAADA